MSATSSEIVCGIVFTFVVTYFIVKLSKRSLHHSLHAPDVTKGHRWCYTGMFSQPSYCNICETLIITSDGAFCDSCGVCGDSSDCISQADKSIPCKVITSTDITHKHHWVKGNLPLNAHCEVCEEECGIGSGLVDFYCCWCARSVHAACIMHVAEVCDFGRHSSGTVPPNCIVIKVSRVRKHLLIKEVKVPNIKSWSPIIVIGNRKSGNNESELILSSFRRILNPAQVIDLAERPPEEALEWCHLVPDVTCRIIVAGGDGSVGWVFDAIYKLKFKNVPLVSILPLGTGNDLSRVLGWGSDQSGDSDVNEYLNKLARATPGTLDRWKIHFTPARHLGLRSPTREVTMNNYISFGVDALVTLNFHKARQSPFYIFSNRTINKLLYFGFGTKDVLEHECKDLDQKLELFMDDEKKTLPNIESIVILNIASWGAGVRPWTLGPGGMTAAKQDFSDGLLEVFCVTSSFHIAQMHIGLSEPIRLGQCSSLKIRLKGTAPMQVDGEPWEQTPGDITITHNHKAAVLLSQ